MSAKISGAADIDDALYRVAQSVDIILQIPLNIHDSLSAADIEPACLGELDWLTAAVKNRHLQLLLRFLDNM